jgi:hypothetical protein
MRRAHSAASEQALSDGAQQFVAGRVTHAIVDRFEAVEVDE